MNPVPRIRLNDKIELNHQYTPQELGFTFIERFGQLNQANYAQEWHICAWVCPDCGSELYCQWTFYGSKFASFTPALDKRGVMEMIECKNAAAQIIDEYNNTILPIIEKAKTNSVCPVCGTALPKCGFDVGNYMSYDTDIEKKIAGAFNCLHRDQKESDTKAAQKAAQSYIQLCEERAIEQETLSGAAQIKQSAEALQQYLLHLIHLEKDIYSLEKHLPAIMAHERICDRTIEQYTNRAAYEYIQKEKNARIRYEQLCVELENEPSVDRKAIEKVFLAQCTRKTPDEPLRPQKPLLKKPGLFNKKKIQEENNTLTAEYNTALVKYQSAMDAYQAAMAVFEQERRIQLDAASVEYKKRVYAMAEKTRRECDFARKDYEKAVSELEQFKANSPTLSDAMATYKELVHRDAASARETLLKLYQARATLYSCNIIFDKYRNFVAISTFYEYLAAGRCEKLGGADGAYNLYESELRAEMIISELTKVVASLEEIKKNQFMLYKEIKNISSSLQSLESSMDTAVTMLTSIDASAKHCAENSDIIAYNTAATAYYSKLNAELTNSLGYMVAFK